MKPKTTPLYTYRLVIATNQLGILNQHCPELRVKSAKGYGSMRGPRVPEDFELGTILAGQSGEVFVDFNAETGIKTIREMWECCEKHNIPNIAFKSLYYFDTLKVNDWKSIELGLPFVRDTIQKGTLKKLVINGIIPKQEIYETITKAKENLSEDVPPEVLRRWKPSPMILKGINPPEQRKLMEDQGVMNRLRHGLMFVIMDTQKDWVLRDYEARPYEMKTRGASA